MKFSTGLLSLFGTVAIVWLGKELLKEKPVNEYEWESDDILDSGYGYDHDYESMEFESKYAGDD